MSKKGTSTESSHDEQTTKDSDSELMKAAFQNEEDIAKSGTSLATFSGKVDREFVALRDVSTSTDPSELPPCDDDDDDDEMCKKRTSSESSHDEQTTKDSDGVLMQAVFQNEEDNTKPKILTSFSATTLEDLPMELIVHILVKAVAMEVKGMRLAKSVWKEKADLVISRLRAVSLQWSSILSIDFFRNELHRTLDGFAQETLRLEIVLHQPPIQSYIMRLTTMRDEVFMLFIHKGGRYTLNVYDRNNVAKPKDVIPIQECSRMNSMRDIAACSVSNCVYLLREDRPGLSVVRVRKDKHQFKESTWLQPLILPSPSIYEGSTGLSVSAQGNLIIISKQDRPSPTVVGIYDANGFAQHKIKLSSDAYTHMYVCSVIQKADGNLVVSCFRYNESEPYPSDANFAKLFEIDTSGIVIREYQSAHFEPGVDCFEDIYGRILVDYSGHRVELLDSEFNLMDTPFPQLDEGDELSLHRLRYNSHRHEMVGFRGNWNTVCVVVTLRFTEE